ncbi:MAG: hypothetical protein EOM87_10130, partial [Clostridia bacterium]|nr:hypothetical protein [Clostridia bacterium]
TDKGKIPYNVKTGGYADSSDPDTFVSYAIMLSKLSDYLHYDADNSLTGGVGLGVFRGYSAVDIDHCVDDSGNISAIANDIIEYFNSYTELSPSKHGVRIIFKTNQKYDKQKYYIKNSKIGLEIYISDETKRFVTITGNTLNISNEIATVNLTSILDRYMLRNSPIKSFITSDAKLRELYNGKAPGAGADESERDASLCCKLAYYLNGDYNAINEAFMSSPYYLSKDDYHKQKWLRDDYKDSTINGAISLVRTSKPSPNISDIKQEFELNDTGNSRRFVSRFSNIVKYNVENMRWMIFNGKHWQPDIQLNVKNFAEIIAEEMKYEASMMTDAKRQVEMLKNVQRVYNTSGKEALLKEAQHIQGVPCINDDFDRDIYA